MRPRFTVEEHSLQFRCDKAVYRGDSGASVCYVPSEQSGELVAAALNHFQDSGAMDKWLASKGKEDPAVTQGRGRGTLVCPDCNDPKATLRSERCHHCNSKFMRRPRVD